MPLDGAKVKEARGEETQYIIDMKVFKLLRRSEAVERGIKIVDAKWLDTNKGDSETPNYRSRHAPTGSDEILGTQGGNS
eukprot:2714574-Karenia_brevis.AAC.1